MIGWQTWKVYGTAVVYQILGNNNYKAARTA